MVLSAGVKTITNKKLLRHSYCYIYHAKFFQMIDQRKLLTIFLFVTGMQLGVVAQTFSIRADRQ